MVPRLGDRTGHRAAERVELKWLWICSSGPGLEMKAEQAAEVPCRAHPALSQGLREERRASLCVCR